MISKDEVLRTIYEAIDSHNEQLSHGEVAGARIGKSPDTLLFARGSGLDSLGLVGILIEIEQLIDEKYEKRITIANEKAMSKSQSPFRSVDSLCSHVLELLA
jgi:hypothetical protein